MRKLKFTNCCKQRKKFMHDNLGERKKTILKKKKKEKKNG